MLIQAQQFGKLFSLTVDGDVYAQPLYLSGITIAGATHNVVYVATEHDSVYAIDADSGTIYSQVSLIPAGGSTVNASTDLGCSDLIPEIGITGTPVIDAATRTLYVVAKAKTANGTFVQYLHALDVATLAEKFGGPVQIVASSPGTASDGNGSSVPFNAKLSIQRPALLLENGHVVIAWAGHCDAPPRHGWVMSYSASTLAQEAVFNVTSSGSGGGIWISGGGLAAARQRHHDDQCDCGGQRLRQHCRGQRDLYDHAAGGEPDVQSGRGDLYHRPDGQPGG